MKQTGPGPPLKWGACSKTRTETNTGEPIVLLGLSGENLTRLVAQEPIAINLADLGLPPCQVIITYGRTESEILEDLKKRCEVRVRSNPGG
jgi:hypothetical protein